MARRSWWKTAAETQLRPHGDRVDVTWPGGHDLRMVDARALKGLRAEEHRRLVRLLGAIDKVSVDAVARVADATSRYECLGACLELVVPFLDPAAAVARTREQRVDLGDDPLAVKWRRPDVCKLLRALFAAWPMEDDGDALGLASLFVVIVGYVDSALRDQLPLLPRVTNLAPLVHAIPVQNATLRVVFLDAITATQGLSTDDLQDIAEVIGEVSYVVDRRVRAREPGDKKVIDESELVLEEVCVLLGMKPGKAHGLFGFEDQDVAKFK